MSEKPYGLKVEVGSDLDNSDVMSRPHHPPHQSHTDNGITDHTHSSSHTDRTLRRGSFRRRLGWVRFDSPTDTPVMVRGRGRDEDCPTYTRPVSKLFFKLNTLTTTLLDFDLR